LFVINDIANDFQVNDELINVASNHMNAVLWFGVTLISSSLT
jgi:hypothetical protein